MKLAILFSAVILVACVSAGTYKGKKLFKFGKKKITCTFDISYTSSTCGKKTVKCKPDNPKKKTIQDITLDTSTDGVELIVDVKANFGKKGADSISKCLVKTGT